MGVGVGMNLANLVLNWVFIYGHWGSSALGVGGAVLASTVSASLAAVAMVCFMAYGPVRRRFHLFCWTTVPWGQVGAFLRLAWPPAVQTLVGQSLGRCDRVGARRVTVYGVGMSVIMMGLFGVLFVGEPRWLLGLFSSSDPLITAGVPILRLTGLVQIIDAVGLTLAGALRGAGLTRAVMLVDVGTGLVLMPPLTYLFGIVWHGGLMGAWLALLVWFVLYAVGMVVVFQRKDWQEVKL